jgi:hypothetical protein
MMRRSLPHAVTSCARSKGWRTTIPTHLTDTQLIDELKRCARGERDATAALVAHLAEMDTRRLHLGAGFS